MSLMNISTGKGTGSKLFHFKLESLKKYVEGINALITFLDIPT